MIIKFNDFDIEKYLISACLKGPAYWRNFPESWLHDSISKSSYKELKKFLTPPYSTYPSIEVATEKVEDVDVKLFLKEVSSINVDPSQLNIKLYDLFEMYATRKVYDSIKKIPNDLEKTKVEEVIRARIAEWAELVNPFEAGNRDRGFIYESAKARWDRYRTIEKNPNFIEKYPFHIADLDRITNGGLRKTQIVAFFASSGGLKSKLKANLAYNFAFLDNRDVMVMTLEIPKDDYECIVDSRNALLHYNEIINGDLKDSKESYRQSLISIAQQKPPLYIVDIPDKATSADIITESELYFTKFGKYPDVVILDYVNEMEPLLGYNNTSEKFKNLGVEIRRVARTYKYGFITSMQENREGKKIKDKEKVGTEHIGESHYFQNVCHVVAYLYQDEEGIDEATNQLHISIKKNRYGEKNKTFSVFANPSLNYIGDRRIVNNLQGKT